MRRRNLFVATAAFVLAITSIAFGTTGAAADRDAADGITEGSAVRRSHNPLRVRAVGEETFEANALIQSTFRFTPEFAYPHSGERVRWVDDDATDDPHTITIVRRAQLPGDFVETFNCTACNEALDAHFAGGRVNVRVNVDGAGLNAPGDSLLLLPGESIGAQVSAPPATNLSFLCAIHPWMQGRLVVG